MDSNRILRSWKRYSSKKSQRFSNLARRRWLKTTRGTINTDAKGEGVACTANDANHNDSDSGSSTGGSTERIENEERNDMMRNNIEAEINVSVIEFLCLNDHLLNC